VRPHCVRHHRGRGIGKALVEATLAHPELKTVRRFLLATKDAHGLYAQYGYGSVDCSRWMERKNPDEVWQVRS
jgi:GNAT superfamily N-acetyltransferase